MGLIGALLGSAFTTLNDVWKDYIYCDSLDNDTLIQKGHAKGSMGAGAFADDNVIVQGSKIAVNDGQMLIVVENGRIVDYTAVSGGYIFDFDTEPACIGGGFGNSIKGTFRRMKERLPYGGRASNDQRAYFVNIKDILNNKFGFGHIPYRDSEFDLTITIKGFGTYVFRIADPLAFYMNVSGNVKERLTKGDMEEQIKAELQDALLPSFADLSKQGIRYDELPGNTKVLIDALKERTKEIWRERRGIELVSIHLAGIIPDEESIDKIRDLQESRIYAKDKKMLGARVGAAQANAMENAANNPNGVANGFMAINMAHAGGNININEMMEDDNKEEQWKCECGSINTTRYCPNCGKERPGQFTCPSCGYNLPGKLNNAKFCPNCGAPLKK